LVNTKNLEEKILPKYGVEKGVGISINRLINYFLLTLSVLIVFSTIGVGIYKALPLYLEL
jgi:small-conductance mechanosensitive channel